MNSTRVTADNYPRIAQALTIVALASGTLPHNKGDQFVFSMHYCPRSLADFEAALQGINDDELRVLCNGEIKQALAIAMRSPYLRAAWTMLTIFSLLVHDNSDQDA